MQNFDNKLAKSEKTLRNIRGIFDNNQVEIKLKEIEAALQQGIFGKTNL